MVIITVRVTKDTQATTTARVWRSRRDNMKPTLSNPRGLKCLTGTWQAVGDA